MAIVSAPAALMTQTAAGLLAAAEELGLRPDVVETTGNTPLGLGFQVPDEVYEAWLANLGTAETPVAVATSDPDPTPDPHGTPEAAPRTPRKRGPNKPVTTGPEV